MHLGKREGGLLRVLAIHPGPGFSVVDVYNGWCNGLRANGVEVVPLDLGERLRFYSLAHFEQDDGTFRRALEPHESVKLAAKTIEAACYEVWPDVVLVTSAFYVPEPLYGLLRARGHKVVILHTESPYEDDDQLQRAAHADLNLINDPTNLDAFRALAPTEYVPHAFDPALHRRRRPSPDVASDFAFVGSGFPSRVDLFEAVDWTGINVALAGSWQSLTPESPLRKFLAHDINECVDNTDAVDYYSSTLMSANVYRDNGGWSCGPREIELAAIGCPFLRDSRPESDALFPMLPTFVGAEDFADKLRWFLAHPDERQAAADAARAAIAGRTFAANAAHLLRLLDR